jgi:Brp/Blh family beta-carotene 15,15'-monooxygenase
MINTIDNIQKKIFIALSIATLTIIYLLKMEINLDVQIYLLFFFVSVIGLPHGFFDFSIGKIIFNKYIKTWALCFIIIYLLIAILYFISWIIIPGISLILFLFLATYHFGFEDYNYLNKKGTVYLNINILVKGSIIVFTPILFYFDEVNHLFAILTGSSFIGIEFNNVQKSCFIILSLFHIFFEKNKNKLHKIEGLLCFFNFILLPPILSFILYFCFMHSVRHFIESIYISNLRPKNFTTKSFLILIVACSLIFSFFSVTFISSTYAISINDTIIKYIFIILACLTLPHMIFNMWPYENK